MPKRRTSRIYIRNRGGEPRYYGDFRDLGCGEKKGFFQYPPGELAGSVVSVHEGLDSLAHIIGVFGDVEGRDADPLPRPVFQRFVIENENLVLFLRLDSLVKSLAGLHPEPIFLNHFVHCIKCFIN